MATGELDPQATGTMEARPPHRTSKTNSARAGQREGRFMAELSFLAAGRAT
jgi:hypothetical protein